MASGRWLRVFAAVVLAASACIASSPASASTRSRGLSVSVRGNHFVNARGQAFRLLGVNRSGAEYTCLRRYWRTRGVFDGPTSGRSIAAIKRWGVTAVRLPLNETCWLGINRVPISRRAYRMAVVDYVRRLNAAKLDVILDMHWAAPGRRHAVGYIPMPDADHAPAFWRSVARTFKSDHAVLFDLYNQPHGVSWNCWRNGCTLPAGGLGNNWHPTYRAVGMQQLINAVRSTGATQPIILGGLNFALDVDGWLANRPHDPIGQLVADEHNYGRTHPCTGRCLGAISSVARHVPVVIGEFGESDCAHGYVRAFMRYADRHRLSYLGWTWNASPSGCTRGHELSLMRNWAGVPTRYGLGLKVHLQALAHRR
jgi:endoglucanase